MVQFQNSKWEQHPSRNFPFTASLGQRLSNQNSNQLPPQEGKRCFTVLVLRQKTGAGSILFLAVLPLLIFLFLHIAGIFVLIEEDARAKKICRETLLAGQQKSGRELVKLMVLNFQAGQLATEHAVIKGKMISAPHLMPLHLLAEQKVIARKEKLDARQKELIQKAELHIHRSLDTAALKIRGTKRNLRELVFMKNESFQKIRPAKIGVEPLISGMTAPLYRYSSQIESLQLGGLQWKRKTHFPFLKNKLGASDLACAASLRETALQTEAILKGVNQQSSFFLY